MTGGVKSDLLFGFFCESVFLAGFLVPTDKVVFGKAGIHFLYGARLRDFRIDFLLALDIALRRNDTEWFEQASTFTACSCASVRFIIKES